MDDDQATLVSCGFNQDNGCFAVAESTGFRIFNTMPFGEQFRRHFDGSDSGIGIVEMLFRCNIFALVGGGPKPRFPQNKVMIWDDHQGRCIGELTFRNQVRAVKLRRDRIAVALSHRVLVYNFADLRLIYQWETICNDRGLLALSSQVESTVVACPGVHVGQVRVELMDRRDFRLIDAHNAPIASLALSLDGTQLATASEKGTLVRIFETSRGTKLQELRRGTDPADITSVAFDRRAAWLAVTSDKNTVHVFALNAAARAAAAGPGGSAPGSPVAAAGRTPERSASGAAPANPASLLSRIQGLLPLPSYFQSEWSFAQFRLPEASRAVAGFHSGTAGDATEKLFVITATGGFYRLRFDPADGGLMTQELYESFADGADCE